MISRKLLFSQPTLFDQVACSTILFFVHRIVLHILKCVDNISENMKKIFVFVVSLMVLVHTSRSEGESDEEAGVEAIPAPISKCK